MTSISKLTSVPAGLLGTFMATLPRELPIYSLQKQHVYGDTRRLMQVSIEPSHRLPPDSSASATRDRCFGSRIEDIASHRVIRDHLQ